MRNITITLDGTQMTVALNPEKETHRKAWQGFESLREECPSNTQTETVKLAIRRATRERRETWGHVVARLQEKWTRTEEPLSKAAVIRECLRRAGQEVEA